VFSMQIYSDLTIFGLSCSLANPFAGDPCDEIDFIFRDCVVASQTEGYPNCFDQPSQAESDACWCKVCEFSRAIEILKRY
jgi:hypothetical protein